MGLIKCLLKDNASVGDVGLLDRLNPFSEKNLKKKLHILPKISNAFLKQVEQIDPPPKECEIEFGLSFTVDGNVYVAGIEAQTTFKVKVKWKNP